MPKNTILPDGTDVDLSTGRLRCHLKRGLCLYIYTDEAAPSDGSAVCFMFDMMETAHVSRFHLRPAGKDAKHLFQWFRDHENSRLADTELAQIQSCLQYLADVDEYGLEPRSETSLPEKADTARSFVTRIRKLLE